MQILYRVEAEGRRGQGSEAAFPVAHGAYRRLVLRRFPYSVYYQPLDEERLEVVAVLHQRQAEDMLDDRE